MNNTEISQKLALAVGWKKKQILILGGQVLIRFDSGNTRIFDYRDYEIASKIANRFNCFPDKNIWGDWQTSFRGMAGTIVTSTAELGIALAVIAGRELEESL